MMVPPASTKDMNMRKRYSIKSILKDPNLREQLLCNAVRFIQAVEGRDIPEDLLVTTYRKERKCLVAEKEIMRNAQIAFIVSPS